MRNGFILLLALAVVLFSTNVMAGTAKGKPFIELEGQIVEVSNAVFDVEQALQELTGQVTDLEERLTVTESSIINLQNENVNIQGQINTLIQTEATNSQLIQDNLTQIDLLRDRLMSLSVDVIGNKIEIDETKLTIILLQDEIAANVEGVLALEDDVANNLQLIEALQRNLETVQLQLDAKQNMIDATCPEGQALDEVYADGYSCVDVGTGGVGGVRLETNTRYFSWKHTREYYWYRYEMKCPIDETALSGGFTNEYEEALKYKASYPINQQTWRVYTYNPYDADFTVHGWVRCMKVIVD